VLATQGRQTSRLSAVDRALVFRQGSPRDAERIQALFG